MSRMRVAVPAVVLAVVVTQLAASGDPRPIAPLPRVQSAASGPWYVDDDQLFKDAVDKLANLAQQGKGITSEAIKPKMKSAKVALTLTAADNRAITPEEVYRRALPSVLLIVSVYKDKTTGEWVDGVKASAWVATADGVLVTNWHVIGEPEKGEVFGAADHTGKVYPVVDFLGGDKTADVAVLRVAGTGLTPLPVAAQPAGVGSWVGVLSHPGDHLFVFTQGHVTRYNQNKTDDGKLERWMGVTAEYASGSSGAPVLNDRGAVVGMTASTITFDAPVEEDKPKDDKPKEKTGRRPRPTRAADKPAPKDGPKAKPEPGAKDMPADPKYPLVQMVAKLAVPGPIIRQTLGN